MTFDPDTDPLLRDLRRGWSASAALREQFLHQHPDGCWVSRDFEDAEAIQHFAVDSAIGTTGRFMMSPVWVSACGRPFKGEQVEETFGIKCVACVKSVARGASATTVDAAEGGGKS